VRISLEEIREARRCIEGSALRTPLVPLNAPDLGVRAFLKLECLQPIGSFKIRGATNAMAHMDPRELARGVLTASAGNMAQGVAWRARALGIPATIVAPETAPRAKLDAIERLGGRILLAPYDVWWRTFQERAYPGVDAVFVHAFDDPRVMAGNGTIGLEILEDLPDLDAIVVPWGGGGLACGIASAVKALRPACRVYAAEVATAAPLAPSMAAGEPRAVDYTPSFVDGIGGKSVFPEMWARAREGGLIDGVLVASVAEIAAAVRLLVERNHVVAEGAGACALACALRHFSEGADAPPPAWGPAPVPGSRVACIVSGGNIDAAKLATILTGGIP
jgi:threonine dehydratase